MEKKFPESSNSKTEFVLPRDPIGIAHLFFKRFLFAFMDKATVICLQFAFAEGIALFLLYRGDLIISSWLLIYCIVACVLGRHRRKKYGLHISKTQKPIESATIIYYLAYLLGGAKVLIDSNTILLIWQVSYWAAFLTWALAFYHGLFRVWGYLQVKKAVKQMRTMPLAWLSTGLYFPVEIIDRISIFENEDSCKSRLRLEEGSQEPSENAPENEGPSEGVENLKAEVHNLFPRCVSLMFSQCSKCNKAPSKCFCGIIPLMNLLDSIYGEDAVRFDLGENMVEWGGELSPFEFWLASISRFFLNMFLGCYIHDSDNDIEAPVYAYILYLTGEIALEEEEEEEEQQDDETETMQWHETLEEQEIGTADLFCYGYMFDGVGVRRTLALFERMQEIWQAFAQIEAEHHKNSDNTQQENFCIRQKFDWQVIFL